MKYAAVLLLFFLAAAAGGPATAGECFRPWNSSVGTGDELVDLAALRNSRLKKYRDVNGTAATGIPHSHAVFTVVHVRGSRVYNGLQGGAFFLIRFFQVVISPQDGPNCRYHPTCSRYGSEAVELHGALLGAMLAGDRIIRCNPYNPPGDDPVPRTIFGD